MGASEESLYQPTNRRTWGLNREVAIPLIYKHQIDNKCSDKRMQVKHSAPLGNYDRPYQPTDQPTNIISHISPLRINLKKKPFIKWLPDIEYF